MSPKRVHPPQMKCLYLDSMEHQTNVEPYFKIMLCTNLEMSSVQLKCISLKSFLQNHIEMRFETIDPVDFLKRPPDNAAHHLSF